MKYLSVCSGIEAATVAWHDLGMEPVGFSEIEPFPCAVLAHRYPTVPNFGDMTKYKEWNLGKESFDILVGGTPCQSFSVAGLRKGMDDPRGNLALVYCGILDHFRPRWFVWENVPGVLSSSGGRDFGSFLGAVAKLGYGFAYRVLDAQYFGVAQRRRRVFVVGYLGDWRPATAVLFERESLSGHTPPRRKTGKGFAADVAPCIGASGRGFDRTGETRGQDPVVATARQTAIGEYADDDSASTVKARDHKDATDLVFCYENHAQDSRIKDCGDLSPKLNAKVGTGGNNLPLVAHRERVCVCRMREGKDGGGKGPLISDDLSLTLATANDQTIAYSMAVRRLTPVECERLQGFPDGYTAIPWKKKPAEECPDGPRYKALGNSMAVPVMRWIGKGIAEVSQI